MATVSSDKPNYLKPFTFQGVVFNGKSGDNQQVARCPFCDREKLYVNEDNGLWSCQVCNVNGNTRTFLTKLYEESKNDKTDYGTLRADRKLLRSKSIEEWGLRKSLLNNEWMIAGNTVGKDGQPRVSQVYLYRPDTVTKKNRFIAPGYQNSDDNVKTTHGFWCNSWDDKKSRVYLTEGIWDAIALHEVLSRTQYNEDSGEYTYTGNEGKSLYADSNIIATPGTNVFYESWCTLFSGRKVTILFDNDHEREHPKTKKVIPGGGIEGVKRVTDILSKSERPPESISYLKWGENGFDKTYPNAYDIRDHLSKGKSERERVTKLGELLKKVVPVPTEWIGENTHEHKEPRETPLPCSTWAELKSAWEKAMHWGDGLDAALPAMLACAASVMVVEDLLWLKVVSPPSTGKTELAEALAVLEEGTFITSKFTGLHSGIMTDDGRDVSIISRLKGKCFIIKEGDTLLRLGPLKEIVFSEMRDAYDCNTRADYKNGVSNEYLNHPFSHILCGTAALHEMDDSELGQRYLNITIVDKIDIRVEKQIVQSKLKSLIRMLQTKPSANGDGRSTPEKREAKRLTAGYLRYLRNNLDELMTKVFFPEELLEKMANYAQFVSYFRARPSKKQTEETSRELSPRLAVQLMKLGAMLCVVLNKKELDQEILDRVLKVTLDTSKGVTLQIARLLYNHGHEGLPSESVAGAILQGSNETRQMLQFLEKIEVTERFVKSGKIANSTAIRWRLTEQVRELYSQVVGD